jgi:hypothetical protein
VIFVPDGIRFDNAHAGLTGKVLNTVRCTIFRLVSFDIQSLLIRAGFAVGDGLSGQIVRVFRP